MPMFCAVSSFSHQLNNGTRAGFERENGTHSTSAMLAQQQCSKREAKRTATATISSGIVTVGNTAAAVTRLRAMDRWNYAEARAASASCSIKREKRPPTTARHRKPVMRPVSV